MYWLSFAETAAMAFASATVFAVGVCYFWPTMLGVTSERVPKSGALGLALMGGMGMLIVGVVTAPQMGKIADKFLHEQLLTQPDQTTNVLEQVVEVYPSLAGDTPEPFQSEIMAAVTDAQQVLAKARDSQLPAGDTTNALRNAISNAPNGTEALVNELKAALGPADNYGGRMSFRYVAPLSIIIIIVFGILFLRDRAGGGYKAEILTTDPGDTAG